MPVTVRHHTKIGIHGDIDGDYSGVLEGINRLVFDRELLGALVLRRGGVVEIPEYGTRFELDQRSPDDGPINVYWSVVQLT